MATRRTLPPVECPRCHGTRTKVRWVRLERRHTVRRHRLCLKCGAKFRTTQPFTPEQFAGMEPAA